MFEMRRHYPLARAGWRDLDTLHARADENPIQKPWRKTNYGRTVWLEGNVLKINDYGETPMALGGVSYERQPFTRNFGCEFDLNIDGNVVQEQFWGAAISPSWASVAFTDLADRPIVVIHRGTVSATNRIKILVYHAVNTFETLVETADLGNLMNRTTYQFRLLVDRDRLVRLYINGTLRLQYWLPAAYAASPGSRALNFLNQTSAWSEQSNFILFDQHSEFLTTTQWASVYSDNFNRANGAVGGSWTQAGTNAGIVSNSWSTTGTTDGSRALLYDDGITSGVQRVEGVIGGNIAPGTGADASLLVRVNAGGTAGLGANVYSNNIFLSRMSGSLTAPTWSDYTRTVDGEVTVANGDTLALSCTPDHAWVELNGAVVLIAALNGAIATASSRRGARVSRKSFADSASWNSLTVSQAA